MVKTDTSYQKSRLYEHLRFALDKLQPAGCWFCHQPFTVTDLPKRGRDKITIHHVDGNHSNNEVSNRVFVHNKCQRKYHVKDNIHKDRNFFKQFEKEIYYEKPNIHPPAYS